jgi:N-glycosylase/DNA lyase
VISDSVSNLHISVKDPFDLNATMESGQVFRWEIVDKVWYAGVLEQQGVLLRRENDGLIVRSRGNLLKTVAMFFRLDDDLKTIFTEVSNDKYVAGAFQRNQGLRIVRQDAWECLVSFVCSSVSNIPKIKRSLRALAKLYGNPVEIDGHVLYAFPTPERLAAVAENELRYLGLGFRAKYLVELSSVVASGIVDFRRLREMTYHEARTVLVKLPGVGEKVADCVLAFSLDKLEGFPIDRWVRRSLEERYPPAKRMNYTELRSWAQKRWGRNAGYVQQYLFQDKRLEGT